MMRNFRDAKCIDLRESDVFFVMGYIGRLSTAASWLPETVAFQFSWFFLMLSIILKSSYQRLFLHQ